MKIIVLTLFPTTVNAFLQESIIARAIREGKIEIEVINFRDYSTDNYKTVDDRPYGGGAGMVLKIEPIAKALDQIGKSDKQKILLTSPRGTQFDQEKAREFATCEKLVIIAGHYEGFDERIGALVDEEISLGDFVLTGGELVACTIIDAVTRLQRDVLKKQDATEIESFFEVDIDELIEACGEDEKLSLIKSSGKTKVRLLEYSQYTRPEEYGGMKVPEILLSGDTKKIKKWQLKNAYETTKERRNDLLNS